MKMLLPGVYQYKFIVDGEWKYAPDQVCALNLPRVYVCAQATRAFLNMEDIGSSGADPLVQGPQFGCRRRLLTILKICLGKERE